MNTILRSLIVWLVLLAVPFQGYASAAMLACGSAHGGPAMAAAVAQASDAGHAHHAASDMAGHDGMAMTHAGHDAHGAHDSHDGQDTSLHGNAHSCSACSACSIGAAIVPPAPAALPVHAAPALTAPFSDRHPPSVHLALPERPPRFLLA